MGQKIQFKRGTAATFHALNPVLMKGEPGMETDTNKMKCGDGVTAWRDLPYINPDLETVDGGEDMLPPVPSAPGSFSPPDVDGLILWMDATHPDYIHEVENKVSLWEDMSPDRHRFVQSLKANRPLVSTQIESQDVVTFDGSNDAMIANVPVPEEFTLLVAFRRNGVSAGGRVVAAVDSNDDNEVVLLGTDSGSSFGVSVGGSYSADQPLDDMVTAIYSLRSTAEGFVTRLNGLNQQPGGSPIPLGLVRLSLGSSRTDFSTGAFSGDVAEVVMYDSSISEADLLDAENYMIERWGVVNVTHPLLEGMKAFWPLNEETGDRLDITAAEVPLTPTGTVGFDSGVIENAAEFTGGNNYLQAPSDFALDGSFAISAWFKAASMAGGRSVLVQNWAAGNASGQVELGFGDDGSDTNAVFGRIATDDDIYTVVVPDLEANLWHHVVLVYSATVNTLTLYLNGLQAAQVATLGSFSAGNIPLRVGIGDQTATQNDLACVIDQLGIWDRVLSLQDVQMLYNYELGKEDFTADLYGDNVSLLLHMDKPANAVGGTDGGNGDPYFNDVSLLLHMNGPGFTDSSAGGLTVTANGNPEISTTQSKFGGASGYFDGSSYLTTIPENLTLAETNWTVEMWLYPLANSGYKSLFAHQICGTPQFGYEIALDLDGEFPGRNVRVFFGDGPGIGYGPGHLNGLFPVPDADVTNKWTHLAVTREGNSVRCFWNGVQIGATAESSLPINPLVGVTEVTIGGRYCGSNGALDAGFNGYIDDLRITKGVARYTANFTPPTAEFPDQAGQSLLDPDFDKVSLLLKMDGANGSTTFTDSGPNALAVTANGAAVISTAQSKFGGASGIFNDSNDRITSTEISHFDFAANDFTIEFWFFGTPAALKPILGKTSLSASAGFMLWVYDNAGGINQNFITLMLNGANFVLTTTVDAFVENEWTHIAVVRNSNNIAIYSGGVAIASATFTGAINIAANDFFVGSLPPNSWNQSPSPSFYIDDLRITKGLARYTANFTPPTASFPLGYTKVVTMPPAPETSLLLHFDGADGSTTFVDSGERGLTVAANSGAVISTAQSKFGGASGYFEGTPANGSSKLSMAADTNFGTDDFTVEAWIWVDANTTASGWSDGPGIVELGSHSALGNDGIIFMTGFRPSGWIAWAWCNPFGGGIPVTSNTITPGQWTHVAWTRQRNVFRIFIDGIKGTEYTSSASIPASDNSIQIGGSLNGATANAFGGYIDEVRVIKGAALYTANFMPPTLPHPNPPLNASLLMHFDGDNNSTTFTDSSRSNATINAYGNPVISTAQSKFGGSSLYLDGSSYLRTDDAPEFELRTGDFTVEAWINTSSSSEQVLLSMWDCDHAQLLMKISNYQAMITWVNSDLTYPTFYGGTITPGEWTHYAFTRSGDTIRAFLNGVEVISETGTTSGQPATTAIQIGKESNCYSANWFIGYIDEFRVTKGQALYTANFTPPTAPFSTSTSPAPDLLLHFDGANGSTTFTDSGKNQLAVTRAGNAAISTAQSRFGGASGYFDGPSNNSRLLVDDETALGVADFTIEFWAYLTALDSNEGLTHICGRHISSGSFNWVLGVINNGGAFSFLTPVTQVSGGEALPLFNSWHHFAAVRLSGVLTLYIDGVAVGSGALPDDLAASVPLTIGGDQSGTNCITGYIDELRIIKGHALYTENFNPPAAPFLNPTITLVPPPGVDPYINNVSLLLHMDGENNGTTFVDSSPNALAVVATGDAVVSTGEIKFGSASGYFNGGSNSFLTAPASANFAYGTEDFTIECWVNSADLNSWHVIYGQSTPGSNYCVLGAENGLVQFLFNYSNPGAYVYGGAITADTWHHIAVCRKEGVATVYVDGVGGTPAACTFDFANTTFTPQVGSYGHNTSYNFNGYIDELRVTKGVARYTGDFTPPTAAFPDAAGGGGGGGGTGPISTFIDTSKHNHEVTATGSAYLNLEDIKYGNASGEFAGGHCEIAMSPEFAFDDGDFTVEFWGKLSYVQYSAVFSTASTAEEAGTYLIGFSDDTNMFGFCYDMDNFTFVSANIAEYYNTWAHYAFVRLDGVLKMYVNGAEVATANTNINLDGGTQTTAVIGRRWTNEDDYYLDGLIDDFRITKGVARYIAEFNPPTKALPDPVIPPATQPTGDPYAENVTLLLHMDGSDGSTNFVDNSYLQNTVIANGDAAVSTEQSKFGGSSAYFDGAGYLAIDEVPALQLADSDFTIEFWLNGSQFSDQDCFVTSSWGINGNFSNDGFIVYYDGTSSSLTFYAGTGVNGWEIASNLLIVANPATNSWHHIAVTREGNTIRTFFDGVIGATTTSSLSISASPIGTLAIGANGVNAYIDDLRITKGVARYTANFTPPTVPFPNPFVPGPTADLLLHFDGANGSTTFTDSSSNALTVTANGNAVISTAQSKFGGASGYFDANANTYVQVPASASLNFGAGDFTVEVWVWVDSGIVATNNMWLEIGQHSAGQGLACVANSDGFFVWVGSNNAGTAAAPATMNEWHHLSVTRESGTIRLFVDGVLGQTQVLDGVIDGSVLGARIGGSVVGQQGWSFGGYIDDLRVVKGTALYTANFTPPTGPFSPTADVTPTDVTGCDLWLDSTGDIGEVNGTIVTWSDKSGNGRTATPADYAPAPTLAVGEGPVGQNVVRFSGDPNVLDVSYQFNLKNSSGFVVLGQAVAPNCAEPRPERVLSFQPASGFDWQNNDGMVLHHIQSDGGGGTNNINLYNNGTAALLGVSCPMEWTVISYVIDTAGNVRLRRNGVEEDTASFASIAAKAGAELLIGHGGDFTPSCGLIGDIAEIAIFDHALGEAALIAMERGLINRCLPPPDPTVLLLHFDGADGSTTFTDSGSNALTVTRAGNAAISAAQSKFGGSSLSLASGYLDSGDFSDFKDMSQGDWTLEAWIWRPSTIDNATVLNLSNTNNAPFGLHLWIGADDALRWDEGTQQCAIGGVVPREQWVHVAAARENGTVTIYVNGAIVGSSAVAPQAGPYRLLIGAQSPGAVGFTSEMYIDELRIVKGTAVYTNNFTPPTGPYNS